MAGRSTPCRADAHAAEDAVPRSPPGSRVNPRSPQTCSAQHPYAETGVESRWRRRLCKPIAPRRPGQFTSGMASYRQCPGLCGHPVKRGMFLNHQLNTLDVCQTPLEASRVDVLGLAGGISGNGTEHWGLGGTQDSALGLGRWRQRSSKREAPPRHLPGSLLVSRLSQQGHTAPRAAHNMAQSPQRPPQE